MSDKIKVKCATCGHVTPVLANAEAYMCEGCNRWLPSPTFGRDPNAARVADSAAERERAFEQMKRDDRG